MENQEKKHKRRVRYSGAYPKSYKEKYKELNPENTRIPYRGSYKREARLRGCIFPSVSMKSWNFFRLSRDRQAWMPPWVTAGIPRKC